MNQLRGIVNDDALETVVEYLTSFDPTAKSDMIVFVEELCGHHEKVLGIIEKYSEICMQSRKGCAGNKSGRGKAHQTTKADEYPSLNTTTQRTQVQAAPHISLKEPRSSKQHKKGKKMNSTSTLGTNKPAKHSKVKDNNTLRTICGCFATHHTYTTSCIHCGRIHCEKEGLGPCLFCGVELIPPLPNDEVQNYRAEVTGDMSAAYKQKDKLLTFDKENAKRTKVNDAQGDYYETSTWLTAEEKAQIDEKERRRLEKYKRSGKGVRVAFDIAGRKIVEECTDNHQDDIDYSASSPVCEQEQSFHEAVDMIGGANSNLGDEIDKLSFSLENTGLVGGSSKPADIYKALRESILKRAASSTKSVGISQSSSVNTNKVQHVLEGDLEL